MTEILNIPESDYHADAVADVPTLSASVAKLLVSKSPLHAWADHPRLNPNFKRKTEDKFDLGNAAHKYLLEGKNAVEVIYEDSYRTKEAKAQRDAARAAGRIPMLDVQWFEVEAMCAAVREQLAALDLQPPLFDAGKPERTIVWDEGGVACRCRVDWLRDDFLAATDLKTTGRSAKPTSWTRTALFAMGFDLQAALYRRGIRAATGIEPLWRWCVVETDPPYAVSVVTPDADVLAVGDAKVDRALEIWRDCLDSGLWPGYGAAEVSPPAWELRWLESDDLEAAAWAQLT